MNMETNLEDYRLSEGITRVGEEGETGREGGLDRRAKREGEKLTWVSVASSEKQG